MDNSPLLSGFIGELYFPFLKKGYCRYSSCENAHILILRISTNMLNILNIKKIEDTKNSMCYTSILNNEEVIHSKFIQRSQNISIQL